MRNVRQGVPQFMLSSIQQVVENTKFNADEWTYNGL